LLEHTLNYDKTFKNGNSLQALAASLIKKQQTTIEHLKDGAQLVLQL
jgi:hypothetical protein